MSKSKIAISIDSSLLGLLDNQLHDTSLRSRSQAIEYFLRKGLSDSLVTTAVLLLRGDQQGVALKPLRGKSLLSWQLDFFDHIGISKVYLLTQRPTQALRDELVRSSVEIIEASPRGNGAALMVLRDKIKGNFLVMSGDTYNKFDVQKMIIKHQRLGCLCSMGLMTREKSSTYGTAILDGDYIVDFEEKSKTLSSHIVNAGIYIFKAEIFDFIQGASLEKDVFAKLAKIKQLVGYFTYGEYEHFG